MKKMNKLMIIYLINNKLFIPLNGLGWLRSYINICLRVNHLSQWKIISIHTSITSYLVLFSWQLFSSSTPFSRLFTKMFWVWTQKRANMIHIQLEMLHHLSLHLILEPNHLRLQTTSQLEIIALIVINQRRTHLKLVLK